MLAKEDRGEMAAISTDSSSSFNDMHLCEWICQSALSMGFKRPTPIQEICIPAILQGRDVIGVAETGSGKTGAFALPILQRLSEDPYGIFCIVITPTRELAIQISEQFDAIGAPISVRVCLIIGGVDLMEQSAKLARRPHIVVGTPGRLRHHLEGADPPNLNKARFVVLDEADRLLASGFRAELRVILSRMSPNRQTLMFSATMTSSISEIQSLTEKETLKFDLTENIKIPTKLKQEYLFLPSTVKLCYLYAVLFKLSNRGEELKKSTSGKKSKSKKRDRDSESEITIDSSVIIFVSTCKRCEETKEILQHLNLECVALHSMMTQDARSASLAKFKSFSTKILVATDVASRGLDIPSVDLVINYDVPKVLSDYVHRIGRAGRAGRHGRSLTFVTQHDVELVQEIEGFTGDKMVKAGDVNEKEIVPVLNTVSKAMRVAQLKLLESGFDEKVQEIVERKRKQRLRK